MGVGLAVGSRRFYAVPHPPHFRPQHQRRTMVQHWIELACTVVSMMVFPWLQSIYQEWSVGKSQEQKVMLHLYLAGFVLGSLLLVFLGHVALQESEGRRLVTGAVLKLVTPVFVFGAEVVGSIGAGWVVVPLLLIAWSACPTRLSQPVAKGWMLMVGMVVSMYTMYAKFVTQPWFMGLILFLFVSLAVISIVLELSIKFRLEYARAVVQDCAHGTHDPIKGR